MCFCGQSDTEHDEAWKKLLLERNRGREASSMLARLKRDSVLTTDPTKKRFSLLPAVELWGRVEKDMEKLLTSWAGTLLAAVEKYGHFDFGRTGLTGEELDEAKQNHKRCLVKMRTVNRKGKSNAAYVLRIMGHFMMFCKDDTQRSHWGAWLYILVVAAVKSVCFLRFFFNCSTFFSHMVGLCGAGAWIEQFWQPAKATKETKAGTPAKKNVIPSYTNTDTTFAGFVRKAPRTLFASAMEAEKVVQLLSFGTTGYTVLSALMDHLGVFRHQGFAIRKAALPAGLAEFPSAGKSAHFLDFSLVFCPFCQFFFQNVRGLQAVPGSGASWRSSATFCGRIGCWGRER